MGRRQGYGQPPVGGLHSAGATVERAVPTPVGQGPYIHYELANADFGTVQRLVEAINKAWEAAPPRPSMAARSASGRRKTRMPGCPSGSVDNPRSRPWRPWPRSSSIPAPGRW